jgi:tRNA G26 N,N-dimethylase Trm1
MIDSHVHLLDMKSEKVTLIKININNNTEAEVVVAAVAPVVMAMFHLHHPTSLAISSLG